MAKLTGISIKGYRSIDKIMHIQMPQNAPLVLVGPNNAGKSNIVRAVELILGEFWPSNYEPEDHEFYGRQRIASISVGIDFDSTNKLGGAFEQVIWHHNPEASPPTRYFARWRKGIDEESTINRKQRDDCICIVIGADRELGYQLTYKSKWTFLSKLMRKFHDAMLEEESVRGDLENLFEQIKGKFEEVDQFASFIENLKNEFNDMVGSMTHRLEIDFQAYNPTKMFNTLQLHAIEDGSARTLEELGTGEEQILAMAFAHAYAKAFHSGVLLIIEEPEAHLHPLAQQWLARKVHVMSQEGLQIIITTHSPAFLNILALDGIVRVIKTNKSTSAIQITKEDLIDFCRKTGVSSARATVENILPFYSASATDEIMKGLFASKVILVEGITESLSLPIYLQKAGLDLLKEDIAIVPVLGKGNLAKWWRFFSAYKVPAYVIFDNDDNTDKNSKKRSDLLSAIGVADHDPIISSSSVVIEERFAVFGLDFEAALQAINPNYSLLYEQAVEFIGADSKPLVARSIAEATSLSKDTGLDMFTSLAKAIKALAL